jgi:hypothetical protein
MRWTELALAGAIVLAAAGPAAAEDNVKKADELFAEGVKLRDSNLELACAKFGESLQLNPQAIGVLLNVAMCDERHGRVASAVRRYRETRERAVEQNFPEYQKAADAKLATLSPEVPQLTIRFEKPPLPQTKIVVDEQVVSLTALEKLPLDPGERVIVVSAPGRISFQRKVSIGKGERREVVVPPLEKPSARRKIGKITFAAGGAAVAAGIALGFVARQRYNRYSNLSELDPVTMMDRPLCTPQDGGGLACEGEAYSGVRSALQLGDIGSIVGGVGVAAMLVGGYLWFFAPEPYERQRVSVVPRVGPDGGGVAVVGRF